MSGLCYCRSGKTFISCCGNPALNRPPPVGLHIIKGFFSKTECKKLIRLAKNQESTWLTLKDEERSLKEGRLIQRRDPNRVAKGVDFSSFSDVLIRMINASVTQKIEPIINAQIEFFELPQLLCYGPGGLYQSHADSEEFDATHNQWVKRFDRDISLLIYINDKFTGGGLRFDNLQYTYQPEAGDLVFFPSGHRYLHQALPVEKGIKYAIVTWMAVQGSDRVGFPPGLKLSPVRD